MTINNKATILLLHGSKDPSWMEPFLTLKAQVMARNPHVRIASACLQFGSPTLDEAIRTLFAEGIRKFVVIPVFISTRGHVAKDVPALVEKSKKMFPGIDIITSQAIGEFPAVQQAIVDGIAAIASEQDL
ncbi:MAG: CbiX/SirB N-terminal domain-containing protein [Kiritimatiellae bacterium]|nr:CbiX/SirB N-terminal domain-containing protein [Kiritimatiellia bacterium]MDD5521973.1 CbiX/SirB N-terminal domain-containing protein [Kiritimatiellia bacterium]